MIKEFVERWELNKAAISSEFDKHPEGYEDVVKRVIKHISADEYSDGPCPDPDRIHSIDDGTYQGTLLFVIAEKGYQPSTYYYVKIGYGSCSGCDTLEAIRGYTDDDTDEEQRSDYMKLALEIVQGLKVMSNERV